MATAELERPMTKRNDTPVRIDNDVLVKARVAASYLGKTLGAYISDKIRESVQHDIDQEHERMSKANSPPAPKRRGKS